MRLNNFSWLIMLFNSIVNSNMFFRNNSGWLRDLISFFCIFWWQRDIILEILLKFIESRGLYFVDLYNFRQGLIYFFLKINERYNERNDYLILEGDFLDLIDGEI